MTKARKEPDYQPLVQIKDVEDFRGKGEGDVLGDRRDGKIYRYTPHIKLHVNVAIATGRPLLLLGPTGCGKSSLAFNLARVMKRRYYEIVVTSRTEAKDLFYRFDAVRRLGDAHVRDEEDGASWRNYHSYIEPGPLWWIFDRASAERRGAGDGVKVRPAIDPAVFTPPGVDDAASVLLIDEVDKAEPDFPNNLLVPIGSRQFLIEELARTIEFRGLDQAPERAPLVVITSNRERELPEAFVRRCVVLEIPPPDVGDLVKVAVAVHGPQNRTHYRTVAQKIEGLRGADRLSIAEFLDAVRALERLKAQEPKLAEIVESTTWRGQER